MNTALSAVGFGIQTAKGAPVAEPTFYHGVDGGELVTFPVEQKEDELTTGLPGGTGEYRESVVPAAGYGTRAWPKSIAAYLYAILGDVDTTGASNPYTHVITAAGSIPYCTVFGKKDTAYQVMGDAKLDELKLSWEGNGPLKVEATWGGCTATYDTAYTPGTDESLLAYLMAAGGTFTVDLNGSNVDGGGKVLGGEIVLKRGLTSDIYSGTLLPGDVLEAQIEAEATIKYRVPDTTLIRLLVTGATNGSTPTGTVPYGDFSFKFVGAGTDELTLAAGKVAWQAEEPEADPKGGPGELSLKGKCYIPSGGTTPFTATVKNAQATY